MVTCGRSIRDLVPSPPGPASGMLPVMESDDSVLEHLSRYECMRLMGLVPVGRIVYTRQALPAVELVNFTLDDCEIVIRTDGGGKLAAATRGAVVAFEVDSVDAAGRSGWSVTVVGHSRAVIDVAEIRRLEQVAPMPWAPGRHDHFIRVSAVFVTGRRIRAEQAPGERPERPA